MWHSWPPRDPPPFRANAILNFHFDYWHTSLTWALYRIPPENFWILDDLFRDTPLDHIWRTHILAKNTVSGCIWCVWCTIAKMWWIITLHHLKEKFENLSFLSLPVTVDPVVVTPATSSCTNQVSARAGYNLRVKGILIFDLCVQFTHVDNVIVNGFTLFTNHVGHVTTWNAGNLSCHDLIVTRHLGNCLCSHVLFIIPDICHRHHRPFCVKKNCPV